MKKTISFITSIVFIVIFVIYYLFNKEDFNVVWNINPFILSLIVLINLLIIFINSLILKAFFIAFNKDISIKESIDLTLVSMIANYFVPMRAGLLLRAVYFKQKHGLDYSQFTSIFLGNYIILLWIISFIGIITLNFFDITHTRSFKLLNLILWVSFIISLVLMFWKVRKFKPKLKLNLISKLLAFGVNIHNGWIMIIKRKKLLIGLVVYNLINFLLGVVLYYLEFKVINIDLTIGQVFLYTTLSCLSLFVSITPASLGIREFILLTFNSVLSLSEASILTVSLIDRSVLFLLIFILYLIFKLTHRLNYETSKVIQEDKN